MFTIAMLFEFGCLQQITINEMHAHVNVVWYPLALSFFFYMESV